MAEEENKKPKIDLRARLGKKTVGTAGPSIPPPMATGASIPAPPFASKPAPAPEPERPRYVEPQAIKIEMGEEVVEAQKKARGKIIMIAAVTAVIGAVIGYAWGGAMERSLKQKIAVQGAEILTGDIDKANAEIDKMDELLKKIRLSLGDGEYPEKEVGELSSLSIPFDTSYLLGKGTNLMSAKVNDMLLDFSSQAVEANELKDDIRAQLSSLKSDFEQDIKDKASPRVFWSVYITNGANGPIASMQQIPEPFMINDKDKKDYKWPEEIEVPDGDKKVKLKLYKDGNPISQSPLLIPLDPNAGGAALLNPYNLKRYELEQKINGLVKLLKGDKSDPTDEKMGLVDLGRGLIDELKGIGLAG